MTKENILFTIIGVLIGLIGGFFFTNSLNQGSVAPAAVAGVPQTGALPSGHPAVPGGGGSAPEVQAAIDRAKQNPDDFEAQMKAAELYYQIQRFDGAAEFLKKANSLQPDNQEVIVNLGNANFDAERYEEAEKWYTAALSKKPDSLDVRTDLGLTFVFRSKPDYNRAVAEFKTVLDADPSHIQALQNLAVAYTKKSDGENASAILAKLEQTDPSNSSLSKLREDVAKLNGK
jgi:tetratricopeptide (TPR) repeat protein